MKNLFARKKILKNGQEGKLYEFPDIIEIHTSEELIHQWIDYGTFDAEVTWFLYHTLQNLLQNLPLSFEGMKNQFDLYEKYWLPFGRILTDIERNGIRVNRQLLEQSQIKAEYMVSQYSQQFVDFVRKIQHECIEFNPQSTQQLQQLLFAPFKRKKKRNLKKKIKEEDMFTIERNLVVQDEFPLERIFKVEKLQDHIYEEDDKESRKKFRDMTIRGLGIPPIEFSDQGLPSVDTVVLKKLVDGYVRNYFKEQNQEQFGIELEDALNSLLELRKTSTLLSTFILSLQESIQEDGRIHGSLNINTETGRLSSKKPNLQNQPSLDKDMFNTRAAFQAPKGHKFVIADYGQLELRVLAQLTKCKSMMKAFQEGGDFHSRTAAGMFDYIQKDLNSGKIVLEKINQEDKRPALKDVFPQERKKAKIMNFSVAYGKTAFGFAKDWDCSLEEAENFLKLWYADRPEVMQWQENVKKIAIEKGFTQTLMGRYRILTKHFLDNHKMKILHGLRAAINTPVQGGAADIVIAAMVKLDKNNWMKENGWKMIHQIHDEIIMEGPEESVETAAFIVKSIMENPFDFKMDVHMEADVKICDNWSEGK